MAGRSKEQGAPGVPLDGFAPLAMTAMLQPPLGGHTVWETRSEINPKASIEPPGASKGVQSPSENFNRFPRIENYQWLTGDRRRKNSDRAVGRTGSRAAEANGPTRALAHAVNCVSCLRGLSSFIQILAFRRLIYLEGDPQSRCERPAQPTPARRVRTHGEQRLSGCQQKCRFF
jgi:hypothetical protein